MASLRLAPLLVLAACGRLGFDEMPAASGQSFAPSNGVAATLAGMVTTPITIDGAATFDTDTGAITGAITRAAGVGLTSGIGYTQQTSGSSMGVFTFDELDVTASGELHLTGTSSAVFLVATTATIAGTIDGSGGCNGDPSCAGPGGGPGGTYPQTAGGCGPGGDGQSDGSGNSDGGGGGGGGGATGGSGGAAGAFAGGGGGDGCQSSTLEPLVGGSGGGGGGPGMTTPARGGGGGGALQITAFDEIDVTGQISMGGGGGEGGTAFVGASNDGAAAGGGGAGGGILLEAEAVILGPTSVLAANGGGGGGAADGPFQGSNGTTGLASAMPAPGGGAGNGGPGTGGAAGGANTTPAVSAKAAVTEDNGGGGGGAVGRICLRARTTPTMSGTISPPADTRGVQ